MCTRLGCHSALLAKLGQDSFGTSYQEYLKHSKINTDFLKYEQDLPSAAACITVQSNGENNIVYVPGAQDALTPADIREAAPLFRSAKVFGHGANLY